MEPIIEKGRSQNTADDTTAKRLLGLHEGPANAEPQNNVRQQLANEWQLKQQFDAAKTANTKTTVVGLAGDLGYSAVYTGVQSPAIGLTQMVSPQMSKDITFMQPPTAAQFGTAKWHAQTIGDAAGMMVPFMLTRGALKKAGLTFVAKEQTSLAAMKLAAADTAGQIADSALTGFVFDFATRPVDMSKHDFWTQRTKNGINGAVTFGTLSAAGSKLGSSTRSMSAELVGAKKVAYDAGISTLAGIPAGIVNAETSAILNEGRLATAKEVVEDGYSMMVAGGVLGLAEGIPKERKRAAFVESERQKQAEAWANQKSMLTDRANVHNIIDTIEFATEVTEAHKTNRQSPREHWVESPKQVDVPPGTIARENTVSLKELAGDPTFDYLIRDYALRQSAAFPNELPHQVEYWAARYARNPNLNNDTLILRDRNCEIIGGAQYHLSRETACVSKLWLDGNRSPANLARLAETLYDRIKQKGATSVRIEESNLNAPTKESIDKSKAAQPIESVQEPSAKVEQPEASLKQLAVEKQPAVEETSERIKETDKPSSTTGMIEPGETVSMRELVRNNDPRVDELMERYYPELEKAFPLEGEIETPETYKEYLANENGTWDMILLRDSEQNIIGGIQFQIVDAQGEALNKVAWVEHIWVKEENRNFPNFKSLLRVAEARTKAAGAEMVFMEFNNPDKMTPEQMADDAEGGITTQDRETLWGSVGIHVAVDSKGEIAPYGQPSMDGQPSVEYLSLGFIGQRSLTGQQIPVKDYVKLAQAAHSTIPGVDLQTDPTVQGYTKGCEKIGEDNFTLKPLADIAKVRRSQSK